MVGVVVRHRLAALSAIAVTALWLAGCEQMPVAASVGKGDIRNAIAKGQLTSPRAATVALISLDGAPDEVAAKFRQALSSEAANREITLTDVASAHYLLRGYLSAYASEGGVTVSYTYDVFDAAGKNRRARIADTMELPAQGDDPWMALNASALASLAGHGADDLAVALGGTPEAQAAKMAAATEPATSTVR
jgi:hypothetical protein